MKLLGKVCVRVKASNDLPTHSRAFEGSMPCSRVPRLCPECVPIISAATSAPSSSWPQHWLQARSLWFSAHDADAWWETVVAQVQHYHSGHSLSSESLLLSYQNKGFFEYLDAEKHPLANCVCDRRKNISHWVSVSVPEGTTTTPAICSESYSLPTFITENALLFLHY